MILLSLKHLNKSFIVDHGEVHAVCDLSLEIEEGEWAFQNDLVAENWVADSHELKSYKVPL